MPSLNLSRYSVRVADTALALRAAQSLRYIAFARGNDPEGYDSDQFDGICRHYLVEETETGTLLCCFRLLPLSSGAEIARSYSAQFYDLSALTAYPGPMAEIGRFCIRPGFCDPDILRVAWAVMTRFVDENGIEMLFGCSSFPGTDATAYLDALALLKERHLGPCQWRPKIKAQQVFRFAQEPGQSPCDARQAMLRMPPLLRTYLMMGGWVSDHAVVDRQLDTLHVFTGVEINAIPQARKRLLRAAAR
ncbi:hypothetical protein PEL8287_00474 [Roseovarius litorisediminis]|uniref:L-ornithine N(alpha)-acyltransferase n=1 Tax=Roseovarius litorisediminis TaxID=1312363 RepID=A0A1Y5RB59_9RHOB|nr:GNAT family N-acetyltransferase [Roseovarius litorisediminis]SLN13019.1 hypothetical protein PEL8287_00474 [Roseovarius litorisediminis]